MSSTVRDTCHTRQSTRRPAKFAVRHRLAASPNARLRDQVGAASAEYAAVTACGVGLAGVLIKLLTSGFGQQLLEMLINFFLKMVGVG